ncbi:hypothetical protein TARUN_9064 [Trichoderma arundinaceum]|uniref:Uncharacterized protein n=1 Tax=Trichoderma arundinaceum TaxID=490622 RepID=A0A395NAY8_TRIAR|nr:hypothetical protein TARUN_9064 [Trichoderma arundinaceum]
MHSTALTILAFIALSPLAHAMPGGYLKSMFSGAQASTQKNEASMDPRLYSIWSSFHKIYQEAEHAATATAAATTTASDYPATTTDMDELPTSDQWYTIASSQYIQPTPAPPAPTGEVTLYSTVTYPVSSCSDDCQSSVVPPPLTATATGAAETSAVQPSQNATLTASTSTKATSYPTKLPPPLNGVSKKSAPVMGAVAVVIAGCFLF